MTMTEEERTDALRLLPPRLFADPKPGERPWTMVLPADGPPMFSSVSRLRLGYPCSVLDLFAGLRTPELVVSPDLKLVVPADGDFEECVTRAYNRADNRFETVTVKEYHNRMRERVFGRPSKFWQFSLDTLQEWRAGFWSGKLTIRGLATLAGVSDPAAARFVHGETLWWI